MSLQQRSMNQCGSMNTSASSSSSWTYSSYSYSSSVLPSHAPKWQQMRLGSICVRLTSRPKNVRLSIIWFTRLTTVPQSSRTQQISTPELRFLHRVPNTCSQLSDVFTDCLLTLTTTTRKSLLSLSLRCIFAPDLLISHVDSKWWVVICLLFQRKRFKFD